MLFNWNNLSAVKPAGEWHKGFPCGWWCCHDVQSPSSGHNMDPPACGFTFLSDCDSLKGMPMPLNSLDVLHLWPRTALLSMLLTLTVNHPPALNLNRHRLVNYSLSGFSHWFLSDHGWIHKLNLQYDNIRCGFILIWFIYIELLLTLLTLEREKAVWSLVWFVRPQVFFSSVSLLRFKCNTCLMKLINLCCIQLREHQTGLVTPWRGALLLSLPLKIAG